MAQKTEDITPDPTGTPPATGEQGDPPATGDDNTKNLVSARDRANNRAKTAEEEAAELRERLDDLEMQAGMANKEKAIKAFLKEGKNDYPDVEPEDLMAATSPEEFEELAKKTQQRFATYKDKVISDIEVSREPAPITLKELEEKEKEIMEDDNITDKFAAIHELRNS